MARSPKKPPAPPTGPAEGRELRLRPDDRFVDAAYRVLRRHYGRMLWNESGAREGERPGPLHDMRVAARRQRAALGVFKAALPRARVKRAREDLRRIGRALGAVRDLDVQIARFDEDARGFPAGFAEVLAVFRGFLLARRDAARAALLRELSSREHAAFIRRFGRWLEAGPRERAGRAASENAVTAAARIVRRRLKKLLRAGRRLTEESTDEDLHAQRIRCKRLRYACEFFADLLNPEAASFAARVIELQDVLGEQHDAVVGRATLSEAARGARVPPALRAQALMMLGYFMARQAQRSRGARVAFGKLWRRFDRKKTRRALQRALGRASAREVSGGAGAAGDSGSWIPD